jgi:hypothetical protein
MICFAMLDEPMNRLLDYNRRRFWLENGWSIRFRVATTQQIPERPHGMKYSFTLHDVDGERLLGFDNAHGVPKSLTYDHNHRFRRTGHLRVYDYRGADELICDFFDAVEKACQMEGVAFEFVGQDLEDSDEADQPDDPA